MKKKSITLFLNLIVFGSFNLYYGSCKSEATQLELFDNLYIDYDSNPAEEEGSNHEEYYEPGQLNHGTLHPQEITSTVVTSPIQQRVPSHYEFGAVSNNRQRQDLFTWYERFNELIEYCEIHGHCNVPQKFEENPQLGIWVNKQRMEKKHMEERKRSSMTQTKIENLESIGFKWAKRKGQHAWLRSYMELRTYYKDFGNCDVPTKYAANRALGRWVSVQRTEYKKFKLGLSKHMTQERVDLLDALGFKWVRTKSKASQL